MGYRNHLHVCQHCGVVHATASATGPERCVVCEAFTFSSYELNALVEERAEAERESTAETERERATVQH